VFGESPLYGLDNPERVVGQYIVIYHENTTAEYATWHPTNFEGLMWKYNIGNTFKGFSAKFDDNTLNRLRQDPNVKEIHCDGTEHIVQICDSTQANVRSWGLARVSHLGTIPSSGLPDNYIYSSSESGAGTTTYVLDTGIYIDHNDFGGRASYGANFVDSVDTDQNSHGTHCAGTIGGFQYGLAKQTRLVAVKVLGASGSGATSGVIAGINWVTDQHNTNGGPSIASMSLGSTSDGGKNAAIEASARAGVVYSVAAGNSAANACNFYPASSQFVISVGATDTDTFEEVEYDRRSTFSNYGECVDVWAPGSSITSCAITGPDSSSVKSGTSMACPHVSGMAAIILGRNPNLPPQDVEREIQAMAQLNLIDNVGVGSPNLLLYNGC
jgi:subtilisin family serine protease